MGVLYLVPTPLGNLEDITLRALRVLHEVDALACEDTRVTRKLFAGHAIPLPSLVFSCHEHNELQARERILRLLAEGKSVALCSDSGFPGISDPGYRTVTAALERGFRVEVLPGPCAVETALMASGLPPSSYLFKGFPPRKAGKRRRFLAEERQTPHTLIFFESPHRLGAFLQDALEVFGNRPAALCLELTKKFERVFREPLSTLAQRFASEKVKGEATVVIAGYQPSSLSEEPC